MPDPKDLVDYSSYSAIYFIEYIEESPNYGVVGKKLELGTLTRNEALEKFQVWKRNNLQALSPRLLETKEVK